MDLAGGTTEASVSRPSCVRRRPKALSYVPDGFPPTHTGSPGMAPTHPYRFCLDRARKLRALQAEPVCRPQGGKTSGCVSLKAIPPMNREQREESLEENALQDSTAWRTANVVGSDSRSKARTI